MTDALILSNLLLAYHKIVTYLLITSKQDFFMKNFNNINKNSILSAYYETLKMMCLFPESFWKLSFKSVNTLWKM